MGKCYISNLGDLLMNDFEDGKRKSIESVSIKKLEEKVKSKGLKWKKLDMGV